MQPVKTYRIINTKRSIDVEYRIRCDGRPLYYVHTKTGLISQGMQAPLVQFRKESPDDAITAECTIGRSSKDVKYRLAADASSDGWQVAEAADPSGSLPFRFNHAKTQYQWRRTRDKALGSSFFATSNFKLVDTESDKALAAYISSAHVDKRPSSEDIEQEVARIDYYADLDQDLELISMLILFGIVDCVKCNYKTVANPVGNVSEVHGFDGSAAGSGIGTAGHHTKA